MAEAPLPPQVQEKPNSFQRLKETGKAVATRIRGLIPTAEQRRQKALLSEQEIQRLTTVREELKKLNAEVKAKQTSPEDESVFQEKFAKKLKLKKGRIEFEAIDVTPEQLKTEIPVVLASGMGADPDVNRAIIKDVYNSGRRTLSVDNSTSSGNADKIPNYPSQQLRKALSVIALLDAQSIKQADFIGHSEAGAYLTIAAELRPDLFRNIVFFNPSGMTGKDNAIALTTRQLSANKQKALISQVEPEMADVMNRADTAFNTYMNVHIPRFFQELQQMSALQIQEKLRFIRKKGIGVSVIKTVDDEVFKMDKTQKTLKKDYVDGFYSVQGTHNEIQLHPELYTKIALSSLDALAARNAPPSEPVTAPLPAAA